MPSLSTTLAAALLSTAPLVAGKVSRQVTTMFMPDQDLAMEQLTISPATIDGGATQYSLACNDAHLYGVASACGGVRATDLTYTLGPSTAHLAQSGSLGSREFDCKINPDSSSAECVVSHTTTSTFRAYVDDGVNAYTLDDDQFDQYIRTRSDVYTTSTSTSTGVRTVTLTGTRYENAIHTAIFIQDEDKPVVTGSGGASAAAAEAAATATGEATATSAQSGSSAGGDGAAKETEKPDSAAGRVALSMGAAALAAVMAL